MADAKITELTENTTPLTTDLLPMVDDPAGSPVTQKMTIASLDTTLSATTKTLTNKTLTSPLFQGTIDGWTSANETWTYASASTITVPSGAVSKYAKGDKIKLTQTTVKYFYIVGVADTVLTVTGGSDYTVADAAISANYYSHASSPIGFPGSFAYTPVMIGSAGSAGTYAATNRNSRFTIIGQTCHIKIHLQITNVGSWSGVISTNLPIAATNMTNETPVFGYVYKSDAVFPLGVGMKAGAILTAGDLRFWGTVGSAYFAWAAVAANDYIIGNFCYEI